MQEKKAKPEWIFPMMLELAAGALIIGGPLGLAFSDLIMLITCLSFGVFFMVAGFWLLRWELGRYDFTLKKISE